MTAPEKSLTERVASSISELSSAAQDLNAVSADLSKAISAIDTVLQTLNIGIPTWTTIESGDDLPDGNTYYWSYDLGYAKVSNKWGISLRNVSGNYSFPDDEKSDSWLFNDAPRWLRLIGVAKIPDLLEALIKTTKETTEKVRNKTAEANQLATAIAQASVKKQPTSQAASTSTSQATSLSKMVESIQGAVRMMESPKEALLVAVTQTDAADVFSIRAPEAKKPIRRDK